MQHKLPVSSDTGRLRPTNTTEDPEQPPKSTSTIASHSHFPSRSTMDPIKSTYRQPPRIRTNSPSKLATSTTEAAPITSTDVVHSPCSRPTSVSFSDTPPLQSQNPCTPRHHVSPALTLTSEASQEHCPNNDSRLTSKELTLLTSTSPSRWPTLTSPPSNPETRLPHSPQAPEPPRPIPLLQSGSSPSLPRPESPSSRGRGSSPRQQSQGCRTPRPLRYASEQRAPCSLSPTTSRGLSASAQQQHAGGQHPTSSHRRSPQARLTSAQQQRSHKSTPVRLCKHDTRIELPQATLAGVRRVIPRAAQSIPGMEELQLCYLRKAYSNVQRGLLSSSSGKIFWQVVPKMDFWSKFS
jgi:hypothetical protein